MGSYLNKPKTEKCSEDFETNDKYECGLSGMQGWRASMEDAHNCLPNAEENLGFFGVYDGHGGCEVAKYCAIYFYEVLKSSPDFQTKNFQEALKKTFLNIDRKLLEPDGQKELLVLSKQAESDPLPTIDELKNTKELENKKEDEEDDRLLLEEANMDLPSVLARYEESIQQVKTEFLSKLSEEPSAKSSAGSTKSVDKVDDAKIEEDKKEEPKVDESVDVKVDEESKEKDEKTTNLEQLKQEAIEEESKSVSSSKQIVNLTSTLSDSNSCGDNSNSSLRKLIKVKPPKRTHPSDEDSADDEDYYCGEDSPDEDAPETSEDDSEDEDLDENEERIYTSKQLSDYLSNAPVGFTEIPGNDSGSTAVVALLTGNKLIVANAGDSRCVVSRKDGKAFDMSDDHKPEDEVELNRIKTAGGYVNDQGRVNGGLNLSRAIGDHCYKKNDSLTLEEQMITSLPDLREIHLQEDDRFMVLACDGIWNVLSSQQVCDFINERLNPTDPSKKLKLSQICEQLFEKCLAPDTMGDGTGCDNMTCMIIRFEPNWLKQFPKEETKTETTVENGNNNNNEVNSSIPLKRCHEAESVGVNEAKTCKLA